MLCYILKDGMPDLLSARRLDPKWQPSLWLPPPVSLSILIRIIILCAVIGVLRGAQVQTFLVFVFSPHRATIEEVEGDVCELESKLDKVSTTHKKMLLNCSFTPQC